MVNSIAAISEDQGFIPNINMAAQTICNSYARQPMPSFSLQGTRHTWSTYTSMQAKYSHIQNISKMKKF